MKYLFLILFSVNAFAGFVAGSKINECNRVDYSDPATCQKEEKETCYQTPEGAAACGVYKLVDTYGGQFKDVEQCEDEADCQEKLNDKDCDNNQSAFMSGDKKTVYCIDKVGKTMSIDQTLKAQKDAANTQNAQYEGAISKALAAMNCGRRVIAVLLVRNASKNLSTGQVKQMVSTYDEPKTLLETGSLTSAKELILSLQVDGTLVTEADKTALAGEIDKCKP